MYPSNKEIHQEVQTFINAIKVIQISKVHVRDDTMNAPPQENFVAIGDVPEPTNISDDPPPKFVSVVDISSPVSDDEVSK